MSNDYNVLFYELESIANALKRSENDTSEERTFDGLYIDAAVMTILRDAHILKKAIENIKEKDELIHIDERRIKELSQQLVKAEATLEDVKKYTEQIPQKYDELRKEYEELQGAFLQYSIGVCNGEILHPCKFCDNQILGYFCKAKAPGGPLYGGSKVCGGRCFAYRKGSYKK